ncbi:MAG: hypothetical protein MZV70_02055 [Desulfobacterales bacterium]|nr:hypothetical protein [Desulfobacterales bacterium]
MLVDKAQLLTLTAPEMTVLDRRPARPGRQLRRLTAWRLHQAAGDAHQRLLREPARHGHCVEADVAKTTDVFEGRDRKTGELKLDRHPR